LSQLNKLENSSGYGETIDDENDQEYPENSTAGPKDEETDDNNIYKDMKKAR
jgi:hypothetical protein